MSMRPSRFSIRGQDPGMLLRSPVTKMVRFWLNNQAMHVGKKVRFWKFPKHVRDQKGQVCQNFSGHGTGYVTASDSCRHPGLTKSCSCTLWGQQSVAGSRLTLGWENACVGLCPLMNVETGGVRVSIYVVNRKDYLTISESYLNSRGLSFCWVSLHFIVKITFSFIFTKQPKCLRGVAEPLTP